MAITGLLKYPISMIAAKQHKAPIPKIFTRIAILLRILSEPQLMPRTFGPAIIEAVRNRDEREGLDFVDQPAADSESFHRVEI